MPDAPAESLAVPPLDWDGWLEAARTLQAEPDDEAAFRAACERLYGLLLAANRQVNLTRLTAPEDFLRRHLLDSLSALPWIPPQAALADVGSGAGFPALPLALARADLPVTAIEATGKKCRFIETASQALDLGERVRVVHARSETLARQAAYCGQFDVVTARAVAALPTLLGWTLPLLRPGGRLVALKGRPSVGEELRQAQGVLTRLGAQVHAVHDVPHPWLSQTTVVVVTTAP